MGWRHGHDNHGVMTAFMAAGTASQASGLKLYVGTAYDA
jgi:hypothetical protein